MDTKKWLPQKLVENVAMFLTFKCVRTLYTKSSRRNQKVKIDKCD